MSTPDPRDLRIEELERENAELRERLKVLEAKLNINSRNSSQPPSADPNRPKRPPPKGKTGKRRKRGGQLGHKGAQRVLMPEDRVTQVVELVPQRCGCCRAKLAGRDSEPWRHQVIDVPRIEPDVTEYRLHTLGCAHCGAATREELPRGVPQGVFGPRLCAMVASMTAVLRVSKRAVPVVLQDWFSIPMSLGSVCNVERRVSEALREVVDEAAAYVRKQPVVHADETGWKENKKRAWLWVAVTSMVTVFLVARSRGANVAKNLLGETFTGIAVTDRWSGYSWVDVTRRQLCWAHLLRDFQYFIDCGGKRGRQVGKGLLAQAKKAFRLWHRVRDGTLTRDDFRSQMEPIRETVSQLLLRGATSTTGKVKGTCKKLRESERAMWTFVDVERVEPTNNTAERAVRHAVLWRKSSFGTDTTAGSRYVERMLTVAATLRQQQRNVLEYVTTAVDAHFNGVAAPSLLPR